MKQLCLATLFMCLPPFPAASIPEHYLGQVPTSGNGCPSYAVGQDSVQVSSS